MQDFLAFRIIFVGGKGGVGKTTISASIATKLANLGKKTLIVSTDPAHSLGDVFKEKLSSTPKTIHPNLDAAELDTDKITNEHFKNIESTLRGYAKPEMFSKIKEHLEFAKESPGATEAAMLEVVCKILIDEKRYNHIVFDTAPTGHTMRLLEMPDLMSMWTNSLLSRQENQDKLKQAAAAFWQKKDADKHNPFSTQRTNRWEKAIEKLNERKNLFKEAGEILKNHSLCGVFLVAIAQVLPLEETKRAVKKLDKFRIKCGGIFINQLILSEQQDPFWQAQKQKQEQILEEFNTIKKKQFHISLSSQDLRGVKTLADIDF